MATIGRKLGPRSHLRHLQRPRHREAIQRGPTLSFHGDFEGSLWILGSGPQSSLPKAKNMGFDLNLSARPQAGARASILYGAPYELAATVMVNC